MKGTQFLKNLRKYFFTGLLVVLPVLVSIKILLWLFDLALGLTSWVLIFLPEGMHSAAELGMSQGAFEFRVKLAAFVLMLFFIVLVGVATRYVLGKRLVSISENIIMRVPLLNKIYGTVKQITQSVWPGKKTVFQKVVLVEWPQAGMFTIGFITSEEQGEFQKRTGTSVVTVFIPHAPTPTTGFLTFMPKEKVKYLDLTVADGFKMVISGGAVSPSTASADAAKPSPSAA